MKAWTTTSWFSGTNCSSQSLKKFPKGMINPNSIMYWIDDASCQM